MFALPVFAVSALLGHASLVGISATGMPSEINGPNGQLTIRNTIVHLADLGRNMAAAPDWLKAWAMPQDH